MKLPIDSHLCFFLSIFLQETFNNGNAKFYLIVQNVLIVIINSYTDYESFYVLRLKSAFATQYINLCLSKRTSKKFN